MTSWEAMSKCVGAFGRAICKRIADKSHYPSYTIVRQWCNRFDFYDDTATGRRNPVHLLGEIIHAAKAEGQSPHDAHAPIHYLCELNGLVAIEVPEAEPGTLDQVAGLAAAIRECGELFSASAEAIRDGRVTAWELARIEAEGQEAVRAIMSIVAEARARVKGTSRG